MRYRYILQEGGVNPPAPRETAQTFSGGPPDRGGTLKKHFPWHPRGISRFRAGMRISVTIICLLLSLAVIPVLYPATSFAAVGGTHLAAAGSTTNQASYTTASITPTANNLVLAWVTNTKATTPDTPTLSGNGLTWVQVATVTWGTIAAPTARTTLFRAMGAAPTAGAVTISFGASQTGCAWAIERFSGVDTSGTNGSGAIVQSVTGRTDSASAAAGLSISLAALGDPTNATAGGFSNMVNSATSISAGTGYTAFTGAAYSTPNTSIRAEWRATGSTTVNVTQSAVSHIGGIAVEIKVASLCYANRVTTTADTGSGSLRECINRANGSPGTTISFNIPGPGNQSSGGDSWWRISPASALPTITAAGTVIDGTTQTTSQGNTNTLGPEIELDGTNASTASGLKITGGASIVRGFVINNFQNWYGVELNGSSGSVVAGNYLNLNAAGTAAAPIQMFGGVGIENSSNNTVGGTTPADRNVIGGIASQSGIYINGASSTGNVILGNYVGLNAAGTAAIPNSNGIAVNGPTNTIGGTIAGAGNTISGNIMYGIYIVSSGNMIQGNSIGTNAARTGAVENQYGILINGASNTIGGTATGAGNIVSGNRLQGVIVQGASTPGNAVLGNAIYGNGGIGIDLGNNGVTINDGAKTSNQPNLLMDYPVFTSASLTGSTLTVAGYVGNAPNQSAFAGARVEIFRSDNDGSGYGEGQLYLGFLTADANGNFSGSLTVSGLNVGDKITGTATDGSTNTSEFGPNFTVITLGISGTVFEDVNYGGGAGRNLSTALGNGGSARPTARVELFNGSTGAYITSTTTNSPNGDYAFNGLAAGNYIVRVVSSSVTSSRGGPATPVMTYRTNATSGSAVDVTDYVGGHDPATADAGNAASGWVLNSSTGVFSGSGSGKAHAFAPVTTSSSNVTGVDFGFNFDTIVNTNDSGQGSLRQFITNANTLGGDGSLHQSGLVDVKENAVFMISNGTAAAGLRSSNNYFSGGVATISPTSALPPISTTMAINAQKQPGWTSAPIIELNGTNAGAGSVGLQITSSNSAIRGFTINRFPGDGIQVSGGDNNIIAGNHIGTNAPGTTASGNGAKGVYLIGGANGCQIGGTSAVDRNVIAGNTYQGIYIGGSSSLNVVQGNYIGTNAAGDTVIANGTDGIVIDGSVNTTIGGATAGAGNLIGGSGRHGIYLYGSGATGTQILGNAIGTDVTKTRSIPNTVYGIYIDNGAHDNTIGGTTAAAGNLIAWNTQKGVVINAGSATVGNAILGNAIYGNWSIGIDLGDNGVTVNDGAKTANQPNLLMDYPVFTSASVSGSTLTVAGYVGSLPGQSAFAGARVEIFRSDNDGSGYGEGQLVSRLTDGRCQRQPQRQSDGHRHGAGLQDHRYCHGYEQQHLRVRAELHGDRGCGHLSRLHRHHHSRLGNLVTARVHYCGQRDDGQDDRRAGRHLHPEHRRAGRRQQRHG